MFLHIIAETNARWTTRGARSHHSHIHRVFEPHVSTLCFPRRVDSCSPLGGKCCCAWRKRIGAHVVACLTCGSRGPAVSQTVSRLVSCFLRCLWCAAVLLPPPQFCLLATQIFFFCLSGPPVTYVLFLFILFPVSLNSTTNFYFSKASFFCFFSSLLTFFWPLWLYLL